MPKTYTDDIAPTLPSSVTGPFQVVDASDATSLIKMDPAAGRIAVAGNARPKRTIVSPYVRTYFSAGLTSIGAAIPCHYVNAGLNGGFFVAPVRIPEDMDVTEPASVRVLISTLMDSTTNGQIVRFELAWTRITLGGAQIDNTLTFDWNAPDNWVTTETNLVVLDNGNGWTMNANTFSPGETLGLRVARRGGDAADNYNTGIRFADVLQFEYTAGAF
jgi:hypothetical protein